MTELGEITFGRMMVIQRTNGGVPTRYLNIETGERTRTSYGTSKEVEGKLYSLSEKEIQEIAGTTKIFKYTNLSTVVEDQLERLLKEINRFIPNSRQKIKMSVVGYGFYDDISFFNNDPEEFGLPSLTFFKEPVKIKTEKSKEN